jgi:1,4-alpha-glucan branching enzyme
MSPPVSQPATNPRTKATSATSKPQNATTKTAEPVAKNAGPAARRAEPAKMSAAAASKTSVPAPKASEPAAKKPAAAPKRTAAPRRSNETAAIVEDLQNVGADIIPSIAIEADAPAREAASQSSREPERASAAESTPAPQRESQSQSAAQSASASPSPSEPPAASASESMSASTGASETEVASADGSIAPQPSADAAVVNRDDRGAPVGAITDNDTYLFAEGSHHRLWEKLGSHPDERDGVAGTRFAVWAPNAESVSVIGDFNRWEREANPLARRDATSGIWEGFVPNVGKGAHYKYHLLSQFHGYRVDKADPFAVHQETAPQTASVVWDLDYVWQDDDWMATRGARNATTAPMSIYEVHLGSWRRVGGEGEGRVPTFREIAETLADYVKTMNFTHVELMPVMEHPFYGSWGYQCTGFFAPTSRYGTPQDLKYFVDVMHRNGIGVILDWVPSHFPTDEHGLSYFDGTHLFEHADPRKGFHPDWNSLIFNYGRNEVRSFLISAAMYWLGEYHADALRVDAVASMLYLDYSRKQGEWIPNEFGGRENVEAISFLRRLNEDVYKVHPDVQVIAEESTAWPMVSRPTYIGGLGFGMKWDMGWMHDTLRYFANDPIHRKFHHNDLTFRMMYAFTENFVLPLSHDEVVHGKGSLINKMAGDEWQRFANLRLLFAHMYAQPGKKLLFMGGEFGQYREWNHDASLDWHLLDDPRHDALRRFVEDLNKLYRDTPALHELDTSPDGFEWIDCCDTEQSVVSLLRRSKSRPDEVIVVVLNFTPITRHNYAVGVPSGGRWTEVLNSDATLYGGSGQGNMGGVDAAPIRLHGRKWSVSLTLPPLGALFLRAPVAEVISLDTATDSTTRGLDDHLHDDDDERAGSGDGSLKRNDDENDLDDDSDGDEAVA